MAPRRGCPPRQKRARGYGEKEAWTLTCEDEEGRLRATRRLVVDRGDRVHVGNVCERSFALAAKRR